MSSKKHPPAQAGIGSPQSGEPMYLAVGFLRRPHGLRGEMLMDVLTDFPERLQPGVNLYLGEERHPVEIRSVRPHHRGMLIHFQGLDSPETAGVYRNTWVFVCVDDRPPLPEGEYYVHQLLGLQVHTEDGALLGEIVDMIETGANDVLVVRRAAARDVLLPFINDVILQVDLTAGVLTVRLLPGLLEV